MYIGGNSVMVRQGSLTKLRPWWTELDRLILFAFVAGTGLLSAFNAQRILGFVMIAALCVNLVARKKGQLLPVRSYPPEMICYTLWAVWTGLTGVLVVINMPLFWATYRVILQMVVMIWTVYGLIRLKETPQVVLAGLLTCGVVQMIPAMMGVTQLVESKVDGQITGIANNPNVLGFAVVLGAMSGLILWNTRTPYPLLRKAFFLAIVVGSGYVATISGSRKTVLIYAVLILIWAVFILPRGRGARVFLQKITAIAMLGVTLIVISPLVMQKTSFGTRWGQFMEEGGGDIKESWRSNLRYEMYMAGFEMFRANPIAGVGLGQFQAMFATGQYSHSDIVESLSTTGFVGFILYQSFYVLLLLRLRVLALLSQSHEERYQYRTMALAIFVIVLFGLGGVHMNSQPIFVFLATVSAYTWTRLHQKRRDYNAMISQPGYMDDARMAPTHPGRW